MPFYPILSAPGCLGVTTLSNFSPNNWEFRDESPRFINLTWSENNTWCSEVVGQLRYGEMRSISMSDVYAKVRVGSLPLLSLDNEPRPLRSATLENAPSVTNTPEWRATLGIESTDGFTSYQGEIAPFPAQASLLSFFPFMQYGAMLENFLLFLNVEKSAEDRYSMMEIYIADKPDQLVKSFTIKNNQLNVIPLDDLNIPQEALPVVVCRNMSGIPLYFTKSADGKYMSLEHTHPPASSVIHGQRWEAQKWLKSAWFSEFGQKKV